MSIAQKLKVFGGAGYAYIYRKGEFPANRADRIGIWNSEGRRRYASCSDCGAINQFSNQDGAICFDRREVYINIESCIVCERCGTHFFITLQAGDGSIALSDDQKRAMRIVRRGLGTSLWYGYFNLGSTIVGAYCGPKGAGGPTKHGQVGMAGSFFYASCNSGRNVAVLPSRSDYETAVRDMVGWLKSQPDKKGR